MATGGNSIQQFNIDDVAEGCNYSDDISAITKKQSPNSMNMEFYNGRIRKRKGYTSYTTPPTGQGGIDTYTKLMLHANTSGPFVDSSTSAKTVTTNGGALLSTSIKKLGAGSLDLTTSGLDSYVKLMLHMDDTGLTDSSTSAHTVTLNGTAARSSTQSKFGGYSAVFDGSTAYLSLADHADWDFGTGDFTVDGWFYFNSLGTSSSFMWDQYVDFTNRSGAYIGGGNIFSFFYKVGGVELASYSANVGSYVTTSAWNHMALVRSGSTMYLFINGVSVTLTVTTPVGTNDLSGISAPLQIGGSPVETQWMSGYIDEFCWSKGIARWTSAFTPPTAAYATPGYLTLSDHADWSFSTGDFTLDTWIRLPSLPSSATTILSQYADANNYWKLDITDATTCSFIAYSAGVCVANYSFAHSFSTDTWYHLAVVCASSTLAIYKNGVSQTLTTVTAIGTMPDVAGSLYIGSLNGASQYYLGYIDELRISKGVARYTSAFTPAVAEYDTFTASTDAIGFSIIDFSNTDGEHQQVAHLGTAVFAYDRVSSTYTTLRTGAPYFRSYNAKVSSYLIQSYGDYSVPYYWDGVASSMAIISANAPSFKRAIEYQGYMIAMNTSSAKLRCYYQPINNLLGAGAAYSDYFTLTPAPNDDEAAEPFLLNGRLYIGTNYSIFRVSYVGGVTVFEFKQAISNVGIVPNTVQIVITKQFGQVALFLGTDKRVYLFDGANVKTISDLFYTPNAETEIALDMIDDNYKNNAFAIFDYMKRIYRLFITKRASSTNYYCMNIDVDTFAYYPFKNMVFSSGTIGYDGLLRPYLITTSYDGILYKVLIDTNTDDGADINEYYTTPLVSVQNAMIKEGRTIDFDIVPSSLANLVVQQKIDYEKQWRPLASIPLAHSRDHGLGTSFVLGVSKLGSNVDLLTPSVTLKNNFNTCRLKLYCDNPTALAWEVYDLTVNQNTLKLGIAEAKR